MAERYQKKTVLNFKQAPDYQSRAHAQVQQSWQQVGQAADQVGQVASQVRKFAFQNMESNTRKEANIAGMLAGQAGTPELKNGWGAYDESYDKAAIAAYKSSSEVDIIKRSTELREEYKDDPDGMANAHKGWSKGMQETLDPELFQAWESVHQAYYKNDIGRALAGKQKADFDANVATVTEGLAVRLTELLDASYRGDDDAAATLKQSLLGDLGLAQENGLLSEAQVIKYAAKLDRENASHQFLGAFNTTLQSEGGLEKGKEMIDNFMNSDVSAEDLGMSRLEMQAKLETAYYKEVRLRNAEAKLTASASKVQIAQSKNQVKSVVTSLNNGIPVAEEDSKAAIDNIPYLDPVKQQEFIDATRRGKAVNEFLQHSEGERSEILKTLTLEEQAIYNKAVDNFESELKDKGVQFLDTFFGREFQPIDPVNPDPDAIDSRLQKVAQYEQALNRPIQLLTPSESGEIERELDMLMENNSITKVVDKVVAVNLMFGDKSMEVWGQIADKSVVGIYAVIGDLARTNVGRETSHKVLRGMTIMKSSKTVKNLENEITTAIGSAFGSNHKLAQSSRQAVQALLMERLAQKPPITDAVTDLPPNELNDAITQVTGGVYNGEYDPSGLWNSQDYQTLLPRGKDVDAFEEWREKPSESILSQMDPNLPPNRKKELIEDGLLVAVGYGKYIIQFLNRDGSAMLTVKNSDRDGPFILDANQ